MKNGINNLYIGVDPGKKGGIGCIMDDGNQAFHYMTYDLCGEKNIRPLLETIDKITCSRILYNKVFACVERYLPFNLKGKNNKTGNNEVIGSSALSNFTMGLHCGTLLSALELRCDFVFLVPAAKWMHDVIGERNRNKEKSLKLAKKLYPNIEYKTPKGRVLDGRADAMLLAHYCKQVVNMMTLEEIGEAYVVHSGM